MTLFVVECVSTDTIQIREKSSCALILFPISRRKLGAGEFREGRLSDALLATAQDFATQAALNRGLIDQQ